MRSTSRSARVARLRVTTPLTATWPSAISASAPRRDVSPAWARILLSLSFVMLGHGGQLGHAELALDLRQVVEVAQAERDEELARGLEEVRPPRSVLAARDPDETPLEQALEHGLGVHAADRVHLGARDRLLVGDDRQRLERGPREPLLRPRPRETDEPGLELGARDHAVAAADVDDLEAAVGVAAAQLLDELTRRAGAREVEHLADALELERRVRGEEQGFQDVNWSWHGSLRSGVR